MEYEPDATGVQRSLGSLARDLVDAGLTVTEEVNARKWAGLVDGDKYARFARAWGLDEHRGSYRHVFDGMEFEHGGFSPIIWVSLSVSEPMAADPRERDLVSACQAGASRAI